MMAQRESKPLDGLRVLVTRARGQAPELSRLLQAQGARTIEIPVIEFAAPRNWRPLDAALRRIQRYDWLVLTSANGVSALLERLRRLKIPRTRLRHLRVAAIGPATRAALEARGVHVHLTPKEYVAEAVAEALEDKVRGKRVLLVRAALAREVLPQRLRRAGAKVTVTAAYCTRTPVAARAKLEKLFADPGRRPHIVTCTSSSTVASYLELTRSSPAARRIAFASIGPITSQALRARGIAPEVEAREYTAHGLTRAILRWARKRTAAHRRADL